VTENGSAFDFPCEVPVKVFGRNTDAFRDVVLAIVRSHFPQLAEEDVAERLSRKDRYVSLTVTVWVESKGQIDALYTELTAHEAVLMLL
jgi:putative lipoic acid-binding regulatory protein